jgi:hypothetical protein
MNWRELNVKGGEYVQIIFAAIVALLFASIFAAACLEAVLPRTTFNTPLVRSTMILATDAVILVPAAVYWLRRRKMVGALTPEQRVAIAKARDAYWQQWWRRPWVRYVSAALLLGGAAWTLQGGGRWWIPVALSAYALIRAWEVSLVVLGVGAAYFLFRGVASLPVSVAVIIGALIRSTPLIGQNERHPLDAATMARSRPGSPHGISVRAARKYELLASRNHSCGNSAITCSSSAKRSVRSG